MEERLEGCLSMSGFAEEGGKGHSTDPWEAGAHSAYLLQG